MRYNVSFYTSKMEVHQKKKSTSAEAITLFQWDYSSPEASSSDSEKYPGSEPDSQELFSSGEDFTGIILNTPQKTLVRSILKGKQNTSAIARNPSKINNISNIERPVKQLFPSNGDSSVGDVQDTPEKKRTKILQIYQTEMEYQMNVQFLEM